MTFTKDYSHNVESIIERLKSCLGIRKDIELAEVLGVAQNTISAWKKRNSMNYDLLFVKCIDHDIDLRWVIYGKEGIEDRGHTDKEDNTEASAFSTTQEYQKLEENALEYIRMIYELPWSVSVKRKMMESYIMLLYEDLQNQLNKKQLKNV